MKIVLDAVAKGPRFATLPPTSATFQTGQAALVRAETEQRPTVLGLIASGRMRHDSGTVTIDGRQDYGRMRKRIALIDAPDVCEPAPDVTVSGIVAEELMFAGRASHPIAVGRRLSELGASEYSRYAISTVPPTVRIRLLAELALMRPGVEGLVIVSPDRHGGDPVEWWEFAHSQRVASPRSWSPATPPPPRSPRPPGLAPRPDADRPPRHSTKTRDGTTPTNGTRRNRATWSRPTRSWSMNEDPQLIAAEFRRLTASPMSIVALIALVCVRVLSMAAFIFGPTRIHTPTLTASRRRSSSTTPVRPSTARPSTTATKSPTSSLRTARSSGTASRPARPPAAWTTRSTTSASPSPRISRPPSPPPPATARGARSSR